MLRIFTPYWNNVLGLDNRKRRELHNMFFVLTTASEPLAKARRW